MLVVVAGSNGAGKSTFVDAYLPPTGLRIVNPDQIGRALAPENPGAVAYEAAQAADAIRRDLLARGASFGMETVFSDPEGAKIAFLRLARRRGYIVVLIFIGLDSDGLAVARVAQRVAAGGHDVPDEKIRTRFPRTLRNLASALSLVDTAVLFDNSSAQQPFRFVAEYRSGTLVRRSRVRPSWAPARRERHPLIRG